MTTSLQIVRLACDKADWEQILRNGGPPCFHVEENHLCLRAERWAGHDAVHQFKSLFSLLVPTLLRPLSEYEDDDGSVLWWHVPIQEPPYVGAGPGFDERHADGTRTMCARLLGEGWLTHWSRIPQPELPPEKVSTSAVET